MNSYADVLDAYDKGRYHIAPYRKVRGTSAFFATDMSYGAGTPVANYYASTPLVQTILPAVEGIYHGSSTTDKYLHKATVHQATGTLGTLYLFDYVAYIPFLDGDSTDVQVIQSSPLPRFTDGKGIQVMIVLQGTGINNGAVVTINYTNSDGVSNRAGTMTINANATAGSIIENTNTMFFRLQAGDIGVRSIESVSLSTSTGGIFALVFVKSIADISVSNIDVPIEKDFFTQSMSMPQIHKDAHLNIVFRTLSSIATTLQAQLEFIW